MDVIVDGESNFELTGEPEDVLSVMGAVSEFLSEQGRGIMSVAVDGVAVTPDKVVEELEDRPLSEVKVLEIGSEDVGSMVGTCLSELEKALPDLPDACRSLAEVFHSETPEEGYEPFQELADIWSFVKTRELLVANALQLDLNNSSVGDTSISEMHEELNSYLEEAAQAIRDGDCVLLGDLLEYELAPRAERETEIVALLQEHAPGAAE